MKTTQVAVIGLGAMGSAALAHLARRGLRPIGVDQYPPGHDRGSSHGWSRVIRRAYFEHPDYVPLLKRAFDLWDVLEDDTGADIVHYTGVLIAGGPDSQAIRLSRESAELHGVETEVLTPSELRARFGMFSLPDAYGGLLEPGGGFAIPEHGNAAHLELADRRGAERHYAAVRSVERDGAGVRIVTADQEIIADHVVIAAGAWTARLVPELAPFLRPQRKVLAWFAQDAALPHEPTWLIDDGAPDGVYYGVPTWPGQAGPSGVKVGFHGPGPAVEPGVRNAADPQRLRDFARDMARLRPDLGPITASTTCTYTMSPDEHFIVGAIPNLANITVACGFSGHGYKFAPVIGEILADFATGQEPTLAVEFLSPARLFG